MLEAEKVTQQSLYSTEKEKWECEMMDLNNQVSELKEEIRNLRFSLVEKDGLIKAATDRLIHIEK